MDSKAEVRFGDRLRECLKTAPWRGPVLRGTLRRQELQSIANAIDQDERAAHLEANRSAERVAAQAIRRIVQQREDLQTKVERLVEELRYSVFMPAQGGAEARRSDVLDVEPFLARLAGIFGTKEPQ